MIKQIKIYDNVFDVQMLNYLDNYIQELPYYPHSSSTPDKNNFFGTENLYGGHNIINFISDVITEYNGKQLFKETPTVTRAYANAHNYGKHNGGRWHTDEGYTHKSHGTGKDWCNVTMLLYLQEWNEKWLGGTMFRDGDEVHTIPYIRNRMVVFPANIPHKAEYHLNKDFMRFSLAFKMSGKLDV
tara:strand:+ start:195 stop:749 length:555 start_codon:yes stop_codon:yes gene_type:complete